MSNRFNSIIAALVAFGLFAGLATAAESERVHVYKDAGSPENKAVFGNIMPARAAEIHSVLFKTSFKPGYDGTGTAVQVSFDLNPPPYWGGLVAAVKPDYWGEWDSPGLDLSKAKRLVFWAKGEAGEEEIQVQAAIASDKPFGDSALVPVSSDWISLTKDWKEYSIPIENANQLKRVITPFALVANLPHNLAGRVVFYVDGIYYEIAK